jgi:hypothetical protein
MGVLAIAGHCPSRCHGLASQVSRSVDGSHAAIGEGRQRGGSGWPNRIENVKSAETIFRLVEEFVVSAALS